MPDLDKLQQLWQFATDQMKKKVTSLAVWQAMESAIVLDFEEGDPPALVLGLGGENFSRSGHLEVPENRNLIEQILTQATKRGLTYRLVECGSREDWKTYKLVEERKRAAQLALATGQRLQDEPARPAAAGAVATATPASVDTPTEVVRSVEDILDRAYKMFASLPHRTLRQSRARFVRDAAQMLVAAEGQLAASGMSPDAIARTIDRAIDRIAVWGECDGAIVAMEYIRFKDRT